MLDNKPAESVPTGRSKPLSIIYVAIRDAKIKRHEALNLEITAEAPQEHFSSLPN